MTAVPDVKPNELGYTQPMPQGGWSESLTTLENAVVVPAQKKSLSFPAGVLDADGNYVFEASNWRAFRQITLPPEPPKAVEHQLEGTWLWGGLLYGHFGHFLTESTTRLWALDEIGEDFRGVLFVFKNPREAKEPASYHRDFLTLMGTDKPLQLASGPTRVDRLIVPGQGFGLGPMSVGTQRFRKAVRNRFGADIAPDGPDKLYISRSEIGPRKGGLLMEKKLEEWLRADGYEIYHPQKHDLFHQIARYKAAKHVLAAEGSALHLFGMVGHRDQNVGIVVRRKSKSTDHISHQIEAFSNAPVTQFNTVLRSWMPKDGGARHLGLAELHFPKLQAELRAKGFLTKDGPDWPAYSTEDVVREIYAEPHWRERKYRPAQLSPLAREMGLRRRIGASLAAVAE